LAALVGLYAHQSEAAGAFGLLGFLAVLIGTRLLVGMMWTLAFVVPSAAVEAWRSSTLKRWWAARHGSHALGDSCVPGVALFGVATFTARVFPRRASITLATGTLLSVVPRCSRLLWS
jgi:hypothetical protein